MAQSLTAGQVAAFHDQGYLVLRDVLGEVDLAPVREEYSALLDRVVSELHAQGVLSSAHAGLAFAERYSRAIVESRRVFEHLDITYPVVRAMPENPPIHVGPAVFGLLTHPDILDIVESILGPEILSNPTQHLRLKPPEKHLQSDHSKGYAGRTTWHQDLAGLLDEAMETDLLTVWIAISDASEAQGCLVVIPGSHRSNGGRLALHCPEGDKAPANYIPGRALARGPRTPLPVRRGSVVLLHKLTQHASLPNRSDELRFAFDLRYQPVGQPTGRPAFPPFVARSAENPERVLRSCEEWRALWQGSLDAILSGAYAGPIYETERWERFGGRPPC